MKYTLDIEIPKNSYIILESIQKDELQSKLIYVISFKKNSLRIGRSLDVDVRFPDISVSRNHGSFDIIDGKFYLFDNHSKFGSNILIKNELLLLPDKVFVFQVGKIVIEMNLIKQCCAFFFCYQ